MKRWMVVLVGVLLLVLPRGGWAVQVVPLSADQLAQKADVVFVGTLQNRVAKDGPPSVIEYTFKIDSVVKGALQADAPFVLRQLNRTAQPQGAKPIRIPVLWRLPVYETGKAYMLFLGVADKDGVRTPVGGGQGVLDVKTAADGTSTVMQKELNNRFISPPQTVNPAGTTKSMLPQASTGGTLQLNTFIQAIRKTGTPGGAQ